MLMFTLSMALSAALGIAALCSFLVRTDLSLRTNTALVLGGGIVLGLGMTSVLDYILLLLLSAHHTLLLLVEVVTLACAILVLWWRYPVQETAENEDAKQESWRWLRLCLVLIPVVMAAVFLYQQLLTYPSGHWDAWAMWNMKARFIVLGYSNWSAFLSNQMAYAHPDYPLLLPLLVSRGWMYSESVSVAVPMAIAVSYAAATAMIIYGVLAHLCERVLASIGLLVLIATPAYLVIAASQYADAPVAACMTTCVAMLICAPKDTGRSFLYATAGVFASLAAWTKNEGLLFVAVTTVVIAVSVILKSKRIENLKQSLMPFVFGALPVMIVVAIFKATVRGENDLIAGQKLGDVLARLIDVDRHVTVLTTMATKLGLLGHGALVALVVVVLVLAILRRPLKVRIEGKIALAVSLVMLVGYYFVFVTTPQNLEWHMRTALERLLLQVWPALILAGLLFFESREGPIATQSG